VDAVVPKSLPDQVRSDVAQDMILGVLSGEISVNGKCRSILSRNTTKVTTIDSEPSR
jgi:hypothetical protein